MRGWLLRLKHTLDRGEETCRRDGLLAGRYLQLARAPRQEEPHPFRSFLFAR